MGYLTIRMLSAGVGASGRVCRPVPHCPRRPQWPGIPPGRHGSFTSAQAEDTQGRPMVRMLRAESRALVDRRATMRRREVERRPGLMRAGRLGSPHRGAQTDAFLMWRYCTKTRIATVRRGVSPYCEIGHFGTSEEPSCTFYGTQIGHKIGHLKKKVRSLSL